jgi:iron complex transport system substrate-binding protein
MPRFSMGTSQVACSTPRNRPRLKGDPCGSAAGPLFILREKEDVLPLPKARVVCAVSLVVIAVACGNDQTPSAPSTPATTPSAFPVTVNAANGGVEIPARPERIVSLSPSATEMLFAIGAGSQVVAVDDQSNYPAQAPTTKLSGFEPNIEAIAGYRPDLVIAASDTGDLSSGLGALDIPVLIQQAAATLADSYSQLRTLGIATGHVDGARSTIGSMQRSIRSIVASTPKPADPIGVYHELDDTYYSATSETFIGRVYRALGLRNIADQAKGGAGDYPQLSSEFIVSSDPDLIVLADTKCCDVTPETVAKRPGWSSVTAVRSDSVVPVDDDIASRWGPRVVDFYRIVAREVTSVVRSKAA